MKKYLVLENGKIFEGESFGADGDVSAELVFSTAMIGYVGTLTDPRFAGQAVCMTFPVIGNSGVSEADLLSGTVTPAALIVREYCDEPSNFRSEETLDTFLKKHGVPGISGIDTRQLTKILRENGSVNGKITSDPASVDLAELKNHRITGLVGRVSAKSIRLETAAEAQYKIALLDLGVTSDIPAELKRLGCDVYVLPHNTSAEAILALAPDGIFVSGGPGSPYDCDCPEIVSVLKSLSSSGIPMMAVGLGHQLLAIAYGMTAQKLPHGHRGSNQPVRDTASGHLYITAQNHGWSVTAANEAAEVTFLHAGDGSVEGLEYKNIPAFSVQFTPDTDEIAAGTGFLYQKFLQKMTK